MFDWLKNKVVQIVLWVVLILDLALLILAGFTQEQISSVLVAVVGIVGAISALVLLIIKLVNEKNKTTD